MFDIKLGGWWPWDALKGWLEVLLFCQLVGDNGRAAVALAALGNSKWSIPLVWSIETVKSIVNLTVGAVAQC